MVRFNFYNDPKPWIEKAKAVVSITGTASFEAALLGKPTFVFGEVPFGLIKGVTKITNIEELPKLFDKIEPVNNTREVASYIKAVENVGESIDLGYVMSMAYNHLNNGDKLDKRFYNEIEKLKVFFEKAYERC